MLEWDAVGTIIQRCRPRQNPWQRLFEIDTVNADQFGEQSRATARVLLVLWSVFVRLGFRRHHAVMAGHIGHHLLLSARFHIGAQVAWLRHGIEAEGQYDKEPKQGRYQFHWL